MDHGKTTLLDHLRASYSPQNQLQQYKDAAPVTDREAGGITQNVMVSEIQIGPTPATPITTPITLLDTPGHSAFGGIRRRGAGIADVVVLVVSLVDGVNDQTRDSISLCGDGVPLIVALNKVDLLPDPDELQAKVSEVCGDLAAEGVLTEQLGGEVMASGISALTGEGVDKLLANLLLEAELSDDLWVPNEDIEGQGQGQGHGEVEIEVVDSKLEKGLGSTMVAVVTKGVINVGDVFISESGGWGRVKSLQSVGLGSAELEPGAAQPSKPVKLIGLKGGPTPGAGEKISVVHPPDGGKNFAKAEKLARDLSSRRVKLSRESKVSERTPLAYYSHIYSHTLIYSHILPLLN